ncbi:ATP-binding cassette domain-containing protein [Vibrio nigripulchritudo]|uniref:ABC-type sugar transport system,ATPase component n=1 Tax=Vibrio nigripulchritudo SOn1 TaxID=1238450 RepID=A0AAV2VLI1_9VIBR|nr:ATP-binding cassette domain-containing protein [Vibrio nigripulchritudo]CCN71765.1 putative ABC-type sugar transport system,ATPase component [Vibrio nigripulchritudo SFn118]CCO45500.1 putative ABC-type sugar transport system,ATPase component [Vibrio nigripulchritudo SOn1]
MNESPLLECRNISKSYSGVEALKNVNFSAAKGEVIGLIGDNGAGKSTLIKILSGVHSQSSGEILMDNEPVQIRNPRHAMGLGIETIYQYTAMVPEMSIVRNMFIGREMRSKGPRGFGWLSEAKMAEEAVRAIKDVGLDLEYPHRPIKELSGGQRQGVAIARAIYFRSRILILDEPTNHLSVKETDKVLEYIEMLKNQGVTCIFISHNLHHVYQVSDRIVAMARGEKTADLAIEDTSVDHMVRLIS